ncbi:hypothetical protein [Holophaga foetida]|uniref:hypothetical protein n=1 Tax=Holophaga foetida TaxID=35839 RepID=UPI0002472154|nr:hypothetical protein [Holophaga foetida]
MISGRTHLAVLTLIACMGCTSESPEAQVKRAFNQCIRDLEGGNGAAAAEILSPAFEGPDGMDRNAARLFLLATLKQQRLGITVLQSHIEAREQDANQEISVVVTQRGAQSVLPDESSRQAFRIKWERRKGEWRVKALRQGN